MILGADISNYAMIPSVATLRAVRRAGIRHLIVRLSEESEALTTIAVRQLQNAHEAKLVCSGYVWPYVGLSGYDTADKAMQAAVRAGAPLATVWFDFEDTLIGDAIGPWMADAARGAGLDQRIGIYTRRFWWQEHGDPNIAPDEYPLLDAHYDGVPSLMAGWTPYGPWSHPSGKQYTGTTLFRGLSCDRDVLSDEVCRV